MLFFDSSALVKKYVRETGTDAVAAKFCTGEKVFVSQITYAECLSAFARKFKNGEMDAPNFQRACETFTWDWEASLERLEVDARTMISVRELALELRGADAIQLSTAIWLNEARRIAPERPDGEKTVEFVATDEKLLRMAVQKGLRTFNPLAHP